MRGVHAEGVGFYLCRRMKNGLLDFKAVNSRVASVLLQSRWFNVILVVWHAPTNGKSQSIKDRGYTQLQEVMRNIPGADLLIVLGDFNFKIGREGGLQGAIGKRNLHMESTDNGSGLASFALPNNLTVGV